jgi:chromosome segregation ATPase
VPDCECQCFIPAHTQRADEITVLEEEFDALADEIAALRAALKKAEEAIERLYFAANWHPDRTVDADALWSAIRDAAGITPGQTASRVGPDRGCEQRDAAEARVLSLEAERASWKTAAEDQNTWLAAHNRAVAAFNVAIGDAQDAEARVETLEKALRDAPHSDKCHVEYARIFSRDHGVMCLISFPHGCPGCNCWKAAAALKEKP